jgi:hypothetical protein
MLNIDTSKILDQQMNRKQFLRNVGIGVVALTGITAALRAIGQMPAATDGPHRQVSNHEASSVSAYGGSVYGGKKPQA